MTRPRLPIHGVLGLGWAISRAPATSPRALGRAYGVGVEGACRRQNGVVTVVNALLAHCAGKDVIVGCRERADTYDFQLRWFRRRDRNAQWRACRSLKVRRYVGVT